MLRVVLAGLVSTSLISIAAASASAQASAVSQDAATSASPTIAPVEVSGPGYDGHDVDVGLPMAPAAASAQASKTSVDAAFASPAEAQAAPPVALPAATQPPVAATPATQQPVTQPPASQPAVAQAPAQPEAAPPPSAQPVPIQVSGTKPLAPAYRINPGDQIEIYVWGEERLQRSVKVLPDGTLAFPLIGQIDVGGMLTREVEAMIAQRLQPQYRGQVPQVTVSVVAPLGMQFSVMGRVKTPGAFSPGRYINLLEAISLAGGPAEFANLDNIVVLRKAAGGDLAPIRVKLGALFKSGTPVDLPVIQSGDTIIVP